MARKSDTIIVSKDPAYTWADIQPVDHQITEGQRICWALEESLRVAIVNLNNAEEARRAGRITDKQWTAAIQNVEYYTLAHARAREALCTNFSTTTTASGKSA